MARQPVRKQVVSRRVAWPEPARPEGGELRLTWPRIAGIVTTLAALVGSIPLYWTISDHWMNRKEIEEAQAKIKAEAKIESDRVESLARLKAAELALAIKLNGDADNSRQQWNLYSFASNRVEYLEDKNFECDAKRLANGGKLVKADDVAICTHYEGKLKAKEIETMDLKNKAQDASKQKGQ